MVCASVMLATGPATAPLHLGNALMIAADMADVSMALYDPITPSGAQAVMEWVRLHHESVTGRDGYSDFYKKDVTINVLGPVGDVVSEWILKGSYIKDATFDGYDWSDEGTAQGISLTLAMDYCVLNF